MKELDALPEPAMERRPNALPAEAQRPAAERIAELRAHLATCVSMMLVVAEGLVHTHPGTAERLMLKAYEAADIVTGGVK